MPREFTKVKRIKQNLNPTTVAAQRHLGVGKPKQNVQRND
jgi:hypothetical protein